MPCFCANMAEQGALPDATYEINFGTEYRSATICKGQMAFTDTFGLARFVGYSISLTIVLVSTVVRYIFIELAKIVKFKSNSQRTRFILVSVFSVLFIYYGVLYLVTPMRLEIPIVSYFTIGVYWDFNQYWFVDIGLQVMTVLLIKAFFPPVEFLSNWGLKLLQRSWD